MVIMLQNKYQQAIEQITTPPMLKEKTRRMLITEAKKRRNNWIIGSIGAAAAVLILGLGVGIWMLAGFGLGPGTRAPVDMELNFVFVDEETQPVRLAPAYPLNRQMPLSELTGALPTKAPDGFLGPEGAITAYFEKPKAQPDAILGEAVYRAKNGDLFTVMFTDTAMLYLPVEISGSHIGDVTVGVGYAGTEDLLYAAFEKNGLTYLITSEGIDRQEFISILIYFVL